MLLDVFLFFFRYSSLKAIIIAMICTCFNALNVPVFWPILVMYFIILFTVTMKRQIKVRMIFVQCLPRIFLFNKNYFLKWFQSQTCPV